VTGNERIAAFAAWIMAEASTGRLVYRERVARHVRQNVGEDLAYRNGNGNRALDKRVDEAFEKSSGGRVVCERGGRCRRLRRPTDRPGRIQS
jgi:hypothetical protein